MRTSWKVSVLGACLILGWIVGHHEATAQFTAPHSGAGAGRVSTSLSALTLDPVGEAVSTKLRSLLAQSRLIALDESAHAGSTVPFHIHLASKGIAAKQGSCRLVEGGDVKEASATAMEYTYTFNCGTGRNPTILTGEGLKICNLASADECAAALFKSAESNARNLTDVCGQ